MAPTGLTIAALCGVLAATATGCGSSAQRKTDDPVVRAPTGAAPPTVPKKKSRPGVRLTTHSTRFGRIVTDPRGRTLYVFTRETTTRSRCYGACAKAWPPLITRGRPRAGSGARSGLVGTTRRRDGRIQVTYRGHPVYHYVGDRTPGEVLCQNVAEYGGTWLVADPAGRPVQ
jgi:predicted lipoprotein with Yx(FWY)xxD motif